MSSTVKIKTVGYNSLSLEIHPTGIEFEAWNRDYPDNDALIMISFDLEDKEDRKAIKNLISHLQHQLQVCEESEE